MSADVLFVEVNESYPDSWPYKMAKVFLRLLSGAAAGYYIRVRLNV